MKSYFLPLITLAIGILIGTRLTSPLPPAPHDMKPEVTQKAHDARAHVEKEVDPTLPVPEIKIKLHPDTMGGYNLQVMLKDFTVTPDKADLAPEANAGHMHVYVNGEKVARMYGEWLYLKSELFSKDSNQVDVTLNANDHADWMHGGKHIGDSVTVPPHKGESMKMTH